LKIVNARRIDEPAKDAACGAGVNGLNETEKTFSK
jgi:hypothetical protein